MKKFPFTAGGKPLHLHELDQDAKDDILDHVVAARLRQADRMFKKGLRTAAEYLSDKQAAYVKWGSEALSNDLRDQELMKAFVRIVLVEEVDDEQLVTIMADPALAAALEQLRADDDPKAPTPPS